MVAMPFATIVASSCPSDSATTPRSSQKSAPNGDGTLAAWNRPQFFDPTQERVLFPHHRRAFKSKALVPGILQRGQPVPGCSLTRLADPRIASTALRMASAPTNRDRRKTEISPRRSKDESLRFGWREVLEEAN